MGQFAGCIEGMAKPVRHSDSRSYPATCRSTTRPMVWPSRRRRPSAALGWFPTSHGWRASRSATRATRCCCFGEEHGHLGQSLYMDVILDRREGAPPPVDLEGRDAPPATSCAGFIREGAVSAVHDLSDGGLLVAIAEMALAGGHRRDVTAYEGGLPAHAIAVRGRPGAGISLPSTADADAIAERVRKAPGLPCRVIGTSGWRRRIQPARRRRQCPLNGFGSLHESWLPDYMARHS